MLPENVIGNFKSKVNKFLYAEWEHPLQLLQQLDQYKFLLTNEVRNPLFFLLLYCLFGVANCSRLSGRSFFA